MPFPVLGWSSQGLTAQAFQRIKTSDAKFTCLESLNRLFSPETGRSFSCFFYRPLCCVFTKGRAQKTRLVRIKRGVWKQLSELDGVQCFWPATWRCVMWLCFDSLPLLFVTFPFSTLVMSPGTCIHSCLIRGVRESLHPRRPGAVKCACRWEGGPRRWEGQKTAGDHHLFWLRRKTYVWHENTQCET